MDKSRNRYILLYIFLVIGLLLIVSVTSCKGEAPIVTAAPQLPIKELSVFAGSASKPPLDEAAKLFEEQAGIKVYLTYGGSGAVLSQMKLGRTGDIYIPGSPDYLIKGEKDNIVDSSSAQIISYLVPAIGVQRGNPKNIQSLSDLARPGIRVGIGNPSAVCVGLYAIEILDRNGLLQEVYKNIVTQAESCEKTATLLSLKSVDAILGWDVFHSWIPEAIDVVYLKPEQLPRVAYIPAAISSYVRSEATAQTFIDFLVSPEGQKIFEKWGYIASEQEARKSSPYATIGGEYSLPETYKALTK